MTIEFTLNDPVNNDQTAGPQNGGADGNDTDVLVSSLNAGTTEAFFDRLVALGLIAELSPNDTSMFAGLTWAASELDSVTVTPSDNGVITSVGFAGEYDSGTDTSAPLVAFTGTNYAEGGDTDLYTLDGNEIHLFIDASDELGDQMALGVDSDNNIVFAVYMYYNPADGTVDLHQVTFEAIQHPDAGDGSLGTYDEEVDLGQYLSLSASEERTFDFNDLPSGQNLFGIVGDMNEQLIIMPEDPDLDADNEMTNISETTNTSKGGGPVTIGNSNQMIDPGEGFFFYYVTGTNPSYIAGQPNGLDQNEADDADNVDLLPGADTIDVDAAFFDIVQTQGNSDAAVTVTAYLLPDNGSAPYEGAAFTNLVDSQSGIGTFTVDILSVEVYDLSVSSTVPVDIVAAGITVTITGGEATITGLEAGMRVKWYTDGLHNLSLVHGEGGKFDIGQFGINQPSGQAAPIGENVIWDDDAPSISAGTVNQVLNTDDDDIDDPATATASFAPSFNTSNPGTDGYFGGSTATAVSYALGITGTNPDSGLNDTLTGQDILLRMNGDVVEGYLATDTGTVAFTISVVATGATGGDVTIVRTRSVVHNDPTDPDETGAAAEVMTAANLVTLTATIKDGDSDTNSATANIAQTFKFLDDGPEISAGTVTQVLNTDDDDIDGPSNATATASFAPVFDTSDPGEDGYFGGGTNTAVSYALGITGTDPDSGLTDTLTGDAILLRMNGDVVEGYLENDTGTTAFTISVVATGANGGDVTIVRTRSIEHDDPDDPDEIGTAAEVMSAANLVTLTATIKDGDSDTKSATANIAQTFKFFDDGPTVNIVADLNERLAVDETTLPASDSITAAEYLSSESKDAGKDGEASDTWSFADPAGGDSGLDDTATGNGVYLFLESGVIVGREGTDAADAAGGEEVVRWEINSSNGTVTVTQSRAVVHDDPTDPDESDTDGVPSLDDPATLASGSIQVTRTVVDGDGDDAESTTDISSVFEFEDDGPTAALADKENAVIVLDETDNDSDDADGVGGDLANVTVNIADLYDDTSDFGSDGAKDVDYPRDGTDDDATTYSLVLNVAEGTESGLTDTFTGEEIYLYWDGDDIVGLVGSGGAADDLGAEAIRIIVSNDPDTIQVIQSRAVKHGDPTDPDEADTPESIDLGKVLLQVTVIDGDLDSHSDTAELGALINIEDDGPAEIGQATLPLEEDDIDVIGNDVDATDGQGDGTGNNESVSVTLDASEIFSGVDLPVSYAIDDETDPDTVMPILLSQGLEVHWRVESVGGTEYVRGYTNIDTVDEVKIVELALTDNGDSTANAVITIFGQLDHAVEPGGGTENQLLQTTTGTVSSIDFTPLLEIADGDGDILPLNSGFLNATDRDDTPEISGPVNNTPDGAPTFHRGVVDFIAPSSVNYSLNGSVGSDLNDGDNENYNGDKTYTFSSYSIVSTSIDGLSGSMSADGTTIEFSAGGTKYFDIVLGDQGDAGDYTFTVYEGAPPAFTEFDFQDLPSGQNLHGTIAVDKTDVSEGGLLLFPKFAVLDGNGQFTNTSATTNTSKGGGPVTIGNTNQMFDPTEGHYFVYVMDPAPASVAGVGLDQNNADDADTVQFGGTEEVYKAQVEIVQVQGKSLATINLKAMDLNFDAVADLGELNNDPTRMDTNNESWALITYPENYRVDVDGNPANGITNPTIISIAVYSTSALDAAADPMSVPALMSMDRPDPGDPQTVVENGYTVTWKNDGTVDIAGLDDNATVEFETNVPHDMTLVTNVAGKYDLGGFNVLQLNETPDQLFEFTVDITDFDGDTDSTGFQVLVDGTGKYDDGVFDLNPPEV